MTRTAGAASAPAQAPAPKRRVARWIGRIVGVALIALLLVQFWFFAHIAWWNVVDPGPTRFMRLELQRLREQDPDATLVQRWVPYERISPHLKRAVIAAEDANFTAHDGVDWDAIERAYERNLNSGRIVRGGSTITMQLAKNLFLSGERSYLRNAQELAITYMIEAVMDKRRILEIYLNVAEWGVGTFGCEAGARRHYGTGAASLSAEQAARMAAMLPRPRFYDRNRGAPGLARRAAIVRRGMAVVQAP